MIVIHNCISLLSRHYLSRIADINSAWFGLNFAFFTLLILCYMYLNPGLGMSVLIVQGCGFNIGTVERF